MLPEVVRFNKFLRRKRPHASTHYHYTNDLELFFAWVNKPPAAITVRDVDRYVDQCQRLGHAVATVNRRLAALSSFYRFLEFDIDGDVFNPVLPKRHFIPRGRHLPRDVEDDDVERLFAVIDAPCDRAVFLLMLRCGLRVQEVHRLSLGDLYLQPSPGSLPRLWIWGKNDSHRVVYLSSQTLEALEAWLAVRPNVKDQAVFLSGWRQRLAIRTIQYRLTQYCHRAGVSITCHQLRHTFARHMVEAGMPVTSIQRLMGHEQISTTQLYLHISDPQVQADYEAAVAEIARRLSPSAGVR
jgi:site-specific recombinase XerD